MFLVLPKFIAGMLLYGIPKVIIHVDFMKSPPAFDWLDLKEILNKNELKLEQFVDCCMIAGTEYCLTYPFLTKPPPEVRVI